MTVSFIHAGDPSWASYRYRALIPCRLLGGTLNDWSAEVVVLAKPAEAEIAVAREYQKNGGKVIVDICDDHFDRASYREAAKFADAVTCPTPAMAAIVAYRSGRLATVIPETYELPERPPHCTGSKVVWFGHLANWDSLERVRPFLAGVDLTTISNHPHATIRWTVDAAKEALAWADIVILPATAPGKSPNRAVEAIRSGCFVIAEPHRSILDFPILITPELEKGITWAIKRCNRTHVRRRILQAQQFVRQTYAPERIANKWRWVVAEAMSRTNSIAQEVHV